MKKATFKGITDALTHNIFTSCISNVESDKVTKVTIALFSLDILFKIEFNDYDSIIRIIQDKDLMLYIEEDAEKARKTIAAFVKAAIEKIDGVTVYHVGHDDQGGESDVYFTYPVA